MPYRLLADLLVLVHLAFIVFVLLGGLLALRWRRAPWVHIPAALWGAAVEVFGWYCPLTPLEIDLRRAGGEEGYGGDFIERYLLPVIYPAELTREIQIMLGTLVVLVNGAIYLVVWRRRRGRQASP